MNQPKMVARTCEACGQPFQARAKDVRRGFGRACSLVCSGKLRGKAQRPASHPFPEGSHPIQRGPAWSDFVRGLAGPVQL